jgi:hypothetical protein
MPILPRGGRGYRLTPFRVEENETEERKRGEYESKMESKSVK